jgi:carnitine O-acetyltransferase
MGVDRHLYALRLKAGEMGLVDDIDFFQDPILTRASTWLLSTSNVATPYYDLFGFGAVASNGYGVGYQTLPDSVPFNVTSFKSNPETDTMRFLDGVSSSFKDFQAVLEQDTK